MGDLALGRARAALELPVVDDDYGETAVGTALAALNSTRAVAALSQTENRYRDALGLAEEQDQRLETGWYGDTVRQRLALLGLLRPS